MDRHCQWRPVVPHWWGCGNERPCECLWHDIRCAHHEALADRLACLHLRVCRRSALGAEVTSTISNGIANPQSFADEPYILMYGMMCALAAAFMWLMFATLMELPVSSTHSIAGAIMGFVMVYGGPKAVSFAKRIDTFPFVAGVAPIIASWFISPGFSGVAAATLYGTVRCIVLRADKPVRRAMYFLPVIVGITFFLESFFVLYKGAKARLHWSAGKAAWVSAIVGCCASIVTTALLPFLSRRVRWLWERRQRDGMSAAEAPGCVKESPEPVPETLVREPAMCPMTSPLQRVVQMGVRVRVRVRVRSTVLLPTRQAADVWARRASVPTWSTKGSTAQRCTTVAWSMYSGTCRCSPLCARRLPTERTT
ncbi:putative phosphate repressible phosphate permease [Trypanosoma vivax]|nr:putative phosphate repressible phosphate permease [Trypanosoma vivax]